MKIKWKVSSVPTGRYRSFSRRGWPIAEYEDGSIAAYLACEDEYYPPAIKAGTHRLIEIRVAYYHNPDDRKVQGGFTWKILSRKACSLKEAKASTIEFLENHPEFYVNKEVIHAQR